VDSLLLLKYSTFLAIFIPLMLIVFIIIDVYDLQIFIHARNLNQQLLARTAQEETLHHCTDGKY